MKMIVFPTYWRRSRGGIVEALFTAVKGSVELARKTAIDQAIHKAQ